MNQPNTNKITATNVDYNTGRPKLILSEYGRCIQNMVEYAKTLEDKSERQRCAETIIKFMAGMTEKNGNDDDFAQKLWNHLAAMANYELDIDYPVQIEKIAECRKQHDKIPYPQKRISKRHYGALMEAAIAKIAETKDPVEKKQLIQVLANQMKRDLGRWNKDSMNDEKVLDDLASYTDGEVSLLPDEVHFLSDGAILNEAQQMVSQSGQKNKKRKKNNK